MQDEQWLIEQEKVNKQKRKLKEKEAKDKEPQKDQIEGNEQKT